MWGGGGVHFTLNWCLEVCVWGGSTVSMNAFKS